MSLAPSNPGGIQDIADLLRLWRARLGMVRGESRQASQLSQRIRRARPRDRVGGCLHGHQMCCVFHLFSEAPVIGVNNDVKTVRRGYGMKAPEGLAVEESGEYGVA